jgi:hypothetical protein
MAATAIESFSWVESSVRVASPFFPRLFSGSASGKVSALPVHPQLEKEVVGVLMGFVVVGLRKEIEYLYLEVGVDG